MTERARAETTSYMSRDSLGWIFWRMCSRTSIEEFSW